MKIILLKDMANLGKRGDVKDVADGYALNVLIKKGQALQATPNELAKWRQKQESLKYKKEISNSVFLQLVSTLRGNPVTITGKKADAKGQLFAQVKEADVVDAIFKTTKFSIDPKQVIIESHIKSLGTHSIFLKQGTQKEAITITVQ